MHDRTHPSSNRTLAELINASTTTAMTFMCTVDHKLITPALIHLPQCTIWNSVSSIHFGLFNAIPQSVSMPSHGTSTKTASLNGYNTPNQHVRPVRTPRTPRLAVRSSSSTSDSLSFPTPPPFYLPESIPSAASK